MDSPFPDLSSFPFQLTSSAKSIFVSQLSSNSQTFLSQLKYFLDFLGRNQRQEKFIFSLYKLILTHIRNNKKSLICTEVSEILLQICLKIGSKFINSLNLDHSIPHSKQFALLSNGLKLVDRAILKTEMERLQTSNSGEMYVLLAFFAFHDDLKELKIFLKTKIKEEVLIDRNQNKPRVFKFMAWMMRAFDQAVIEEFFLPSFLNLLKRSENNVEIVKEIIGNNDHFKVDTSKFCEEFLFEGLKEIFGGKNGDSAVIVAISMVRNVENFDALLKLVKRLEALIQSLLNEGHKMNVIRILEGVIFRLTLISDEKAIKTLHSSILQIFSSNFSLLSNEESLPVLKNLFLTLAKTPHALTYEPSFFQSLKKTLTTSKFGSNCVVLFISNVLLTRNEVILENGKDIQILIETVLNQIILAQLKQAGKLVSGYTLFLNAMDMLGETIGTCLQENIKYEAAFTGFFAENINFHQAKFINKGSTNDLGLLLRICLSFCSFSSANQSYELSKPLVFSNTLIQTIMEPNITLHYLNLAIKKLDKPGLMVFSSYIISGIFGKILTNPAFEELDEQKIVFLLKIIVENPPDFTQFEPLALLAIFYFNKRLTPYFIKKIKENESFCETLSSKVNEILMFHSVYARKLPFFFKAWVQAFIDLDLTPLLFDRLLPFIDISNFENIELFDQFEEEINSESNAHFLRYAEEISQTSHVLNFQVFEELLPKLHEKQGEKEKGKKQAVAVAKGASQKGGKKVNVGKNMDKAKAEQKFEQKMEFMDEEEMLKLQKEQTYRKYANFVKKIEDLMRLLAKGGAESYFLSEVFGRMQRLADEEEFRGVFRDLCLVFFKRNEDLTRQSSLLTEILVQGSLNEGVSNTVSMQKFLAFLLDLLTKKELPKYWLAFFLDLSMHILRSKDYELQIKSSVLKIMTILSEKEVLNYKLESLYKTLVQNINVAAQHEDLTINLLQFLLKKIDSSLIPMLFDRLLQVSHKAKNLLLKTVLSEASTLPLTPSFSIFAKLKVLSLDQNPLSESLISSALFSSYKPNADDIRAFPFASFLAENSKDSNDHFCLFLNSLLKDFDSLIDVMFESFLKATEESLGTLSLEDEGFLFFPHFLKLNITMIPSSLLGKVFSLIIDKFCVENNPLLLEQVLAVGKDIINMYGQSQQETLISLFDGYLDRKDLDMGKQVSILTFMGVLSKYLSNPKRIEVLARKILEVIMEANQNFQLSLARCLADTIVFFKDPELIIEEKERDCLKETNKTRQRGCAFLVAGLVRGLGIAVIEKLGLLKFVKTSIEATVKKDKDITVKQGVLYLLQALIECNGKLMEPYIIEILEICMNFFGENNEILRTLSLENTRSAMSKLSCYGVQMVLPLLLKGLEEKSNWRAKLANISALGNMAYCSPKQLSGCLPQIIPCLSAALADTHPKIREGASEALQVIGHTIKNPEIAENVDILIKSINNPFDENKRGLEVLLKTQFVHYIDVPSLSLIIPIVDYGLRSRESKLKENAAQVVGTITHLIKDIKCLLPYNEILINALKIAICDPISDVRTIAAKAFGSLARKLGEANSGRIIEVLKGILEHPDSKSNDKAGGAQAYSEVIWAIGPDYFEQHKDYIMQCTIDQNIYMRESYIGLFVYLPGIMEEAFEKYLSSILDNLVESLADENESIRSLTLRVLRIFIEKYGHKKTHLLLIPINEGLFSPNMRKRNSAISLTGDLIRVLTRRISPDCQPIYEELLASVYILRHDEYESVRNCAENVWKEGVVNKPKTLKQIMPTLVQKFMKLITMEEEIGRIAEITIKEYCLKYSDSVFADLFEILEKIIASEELDLRGAFMVLENVLKETHVSNVLKYVNNVETVLRKYMLANDELLRKSVFSCFRSLLDKFHDQKPLINLIEPFFQTLASRNENDEDYESLLKVFDELVALESPKITSFLMRTLFVLPLEQYKIEIITNNAASFGVEIYEHPDLNDIFPLLYDQTFTSIGDQSRHASLIYCLSQLSINVSEEHSGYFVSESIELIRKYKDKNRERLIVVLEILKFFFQNSLIDFEKFVTEYNYIFIPFLFIENPEMAELVNNLLKALLKTQNKDVCSLYLTSFFSNLHTYLHNNKNAACYGMNQESGLDPYIHILINTLVYGSQEDCNVALDFYLTIFKLVAPSYIIPHSLKLIGPLIRVANYNYPIEIKEKLVRILLSAHKLDIGMKPFEAQLQLTYLRLVKESNGEKQVFRDCVSLYSELIRASPRRDFFLNEIIIKSKRNPKDSSHFFKLIHKMLAGQGNLFSKALIENIFNQLAALLMDANITEIDVKPISSALGVLSLIIPQKAWKPLLINYSENLDKLENNDLIKALCAIISIIRRNNIDEDITKIQRKAAEKINSVIPNLNNDEIILVLKMIRKIKEGVAGEVRKKIFLEKLKRETKEEAKIAELIAKIEWI